MLKVGIVLAFLGTVALATPPGESSVFTKKEYEEIDKSIGTYLKKHPEIIVQILQDFSTQHQKESLEKIQIHVGAATKELADPQNAIVMGNPDSPIKLILFVDPNCPYCRVFESALKKIQETLPEKEKPCIMIRQWPILGENSKEVAAGLIAANTQDPKKFQILFEKIMKGDKPWQPRNFFLVAKESGYNPDKIKTLLKEAKVQNQIKNTNDLAIKIGLEATPSLILVDPKGARLIPLSDEKALKTLVLEAVQSVK